MLLLTKCSHASGNASFPPPHPRSRLLNLRQPVRLKPSRRPLGLLQEDLGRQEVCAPSVRLRSGVRAPLPPPPPPRSRAARDVRAPSCPPLSFHLRHSHPTPSIPLSLPPLLQPTLLPLSINLPPPSTPPSLLSVYLVHQLILPSFCQKPYFHARSFHPPLPPYNFSCVCQHPPCSLSLTFYTPPRTARARVRAARLICSPHLTLGLVPPSARLLH